LDVEITQVRGRARDQVRVDVTSRGPEVELTVVLSVPLGAREGMCTARAGRMESPPGQGPHDASCTAVLQVEEGRAGRAEATWAGGLSVAAPLVDLVPGQASHGVRVVDFTAGAGGGWVLVLEGEAGLSYDVRLFGDTPTLARTDGATAELVPGAGEGKAPHLARVRFPEGVGRRLATLHLVPAR
jgi:hypothetical protein